MTEAGIVVCVVCIAFGGLGLLWGWLCQKDVAPLERGNEELRQQVRWWRKRCETLQLGNQEPLPPVERADPRPMWNRADEPEEAAG